MRGISVFFYSVKQGIKSMRKNRMFTLASIGTMAACLFLFGMFYFIVSNFNHMVKEVETSVGVTVFLKRTFPRSRSIPSERQLKPGMKWIIWSLSLLRKPGISL